MRSSDHRKKRKTFKVNTLQPLSQSRFRIIFFLLCLGLGGLFLRVGWLQLFQSDQLRALAREVQTEQKNPLGTRRSILDRNGKLVAIDERRFKIWAHPRYLTFLVMHLGQFVNQSKWQSFFLRHYPKVLMRF